jgi:hypothetical protein
MPDESVSKHIRPTTTINAAQLTLPTGRIESVHYEIAITLSRMFGHQLIVTF